jgi:hypothetical protein
LIVFKGALILTSSTKFCWRDIWIDEDVENFYGFYMITSGFKTEFIREIQVIIVQIWELKGIGKTFEEKLKKLANVLVNGYG